MKSKTQDVIFFMVMLILMAYIGYGLVIDDNNSGYSEDLFTQLSAQSKIEGRGILNLIVVDSVGESTIRERTSRGGAFIVVMTDSSCTPCFGNFIKGFIMSLQQNGYLVDPKRWVCLFAGKKPNLALSNVQHILGPQAAFVFATNLDESLSIGEDSMLLYVIPENTILASSRVTNVSEVGKEYFINRVIGHIDSK